MALATRCPHCATIFRVANDQLKLHAGIVRCGACQQTFNGIEHLLAPTVITTAVNVPAVKFPAAKSPQANAPSIKAPALNTAASVISKRSTVDEINPVAVPPSPTPTPAPRPQIAQAQEAPVAPSQTPVVADTPTPESSPLPTAQAVPPYFSTPAPTPKAPGSKFSPSVFRKRPSPVESEPAIDVPTSAPAEHQASITDAIDFDVESISDLRDSDEQQQHAPALPIVLPEDIAVAAKQEAIAKAVLSANTSNMSISDSANFPTELHSILRLDDDQDAAATASAVTRAEPYFSSKEETIDKSRANDTPEFIRKAEYQKNKGRKVRGLMWALLIMLVPGAFGQAAFTFRNYLAAAIPETKPALLEGCQLLRCELKLPAQIDLLSIESNELVTLPKSHHFSFAVQLQNKSTLVQTWPVLELSLTNAKDQPQVVKAFKPADYIQDKALLLRGFAPSSEHNIKLYFELIDIETSSYRVAIYY